ncbi:MAG: TraR/DksA family transcriptional regulator [Nitrospirae bacterium]|nr:MAG: TraR/DksA family transcriptional regulator [Nitrospirota bacterium]
MKKKTNKAAKSDKVKAKPKTTAAKAAKPAIKSGNAQNTALKNTKSASIKKDKPASNKKSPTPQAASANKSSKQSVETEDLRKERLRKILVIKREAILKEGKTEIRKYISGEKKQLVETVMDDGDLSVVDLAEDISLKQLSTHRETLIKIDIALQKLEDGSYGLCEDCGDDISEERLRIMPFAIFCRDCQEKKEIMEKMEKEGY